MLASILLYLPISNATVEQLFSIMGVVKTKIRNSLATPMVEAILFVRYSLKRRSETCADCIILPQMLTKFNYNMYDHIRARNVLGPRVNQDQDIDDEEEENDLVQVLDDVEELFGEPIFLTFN